MRELLGWLSASRSSRPAPTPCSTARTSRWSTGPRPRARGRQTRDPRSWRRCPAPCAASPRWPRTRPTRRSSGTSTRAASRPGRGPRRAGAAGGRGAAAGEGGPSRGRSAGSSTSGRFYALMKFADTFDLVLLRKDFRDEAVKLLEADPAMKGADLVRFKTAAEPAEVAGRDRRRRPAAGDGGATRGLRQVRAPHGREPRRPRDAGEPQRQGHRGLRAARPPRALGHRSRRPSTTSSRPPRRPAATRTSGAGATSRRRSASCAASPARRAATCARSARGPCTACCRRPRTSGRARSAGWSWSPAEPRPSWP